MMRILVVEDEPVLGEAIVMALRTTFDHDVDFAPDGEQALALTHDHSYALAVLDWSLPRTSGIELLAQWREDPAVSRVLMLSAWDGDNRRARALESGADDYLTKPFTLGELRERARSLLDLPDPRG